MDNDGRGGQLPEPGGYKFSDYIKVGLPLTLLILIIVLLILPIVWPF